MAMMFQCELRRGANKTIAWIEERGAKVGADVQLVTADGEFWTVVEVYEPGLEEAVLRAKQAADRGSAAMPPHVTVKAALDWYDLIEPNIRNAVRLLRDNGFNTTCSCHHSMEIEGNLTTDGEINRLHHLLFNEGYENYTIKAEMKVSDGWLLWTRFYLQLPKAK